MVKCSHNHSEMFTLFILILSHCLRVCANTRTLILTFSFELLLMILPLSVASCCSASDISFSRVENIFEQLLTSATLYNNILYSIFITYIPVHKHCNSINQRICDSLLLSEHGIHTQQKITRLIEIL